MADFFEPLQSKLDRSNFENEFIYGSSSNLQAAPQFQYTLYRYLFVAAE
jgi:hypothetical protein